MGKVIYFLLIGIFVFGGEVKSQVKLDENFNSTSYPPTGWHTKKINGSGYSAWYRHHNAGIGGSGAAANSISTGPVNPLGSTNEGWLVTKQFSVGSYDTLSFQFKRSISSYTSLNEQLQIKVSTTDTAIGSFSTLATINVTNLTNNTWIEFKYNLSSSYDGDDIYVAFVYSADDGFRTYLDNVLVGQEAEDVGVASYVSPSGSFCPGVVISPIVTVSNFGAVAENNLDVYYTQNGGSAVGPVTISLGIGETDTVIFRGGNSATLVSGTNTFKFYTSLPSDLDNTNDTLTYVINTETPITAYPYFENFTSISDWVISGDPLWSQYKATDLVNSSGATGDTAMYLDFFYNQQETGNFSSPPFDLSGLSSPVLNFYVAYRSYSSSYDDRLQLIISTNGGLTYEPPIYDKSRLSSPSLSTVGDSTGVFIPSEGSQWRHESVDLSAYAGQSCIVFSFMGDAALGNNCWIDDFSISEATDFATQVVNDTGNVNFSGAFSPGSNYSVTLNMTSIGDPGGNMNFVRKKINPPSLVYPQISTNSSATTDDGSVYTPDTMSANGYYILTYDYGNDATYNVSIDISAYNDVIIAEKVYIVKRNNMNSPWVCLNTSLSGTVLTATGLTGFSQFGIAGDLDYLLPVELSSFTSSVELRNVHLNWTTASERNNSGFDIERKADGNEGWSKLDFIEGTGTDKTPSSYNYTDRGLSSGTYFYRLKQIDYNGNFEYYQLENEVIIGVPQKYALSQNYPNPFNPATKINFDLPFDSKVTIKVFDITGREIKTLVNEVQTAGYYTVTFNAHSFASGMYFYRIVAEGLQEKYVETKKMVLIK